MCPWARWSWRAGVSPVRAEEADVPVCIHSDHRASFEQFSIALVAGVQAYCQEHPKAFYPMDVLQAGLDRVIDIARSRIQVIRADGRV